MHRFDSWLKVNKVVQSANRANKKKNMYKAVYISRILMRLYNLDQTGYYIKNNATGKFL